MADGAKRENNQFGLRQRLFETMDALRRGDIEYQDATATAKLAAQIIASERLEVEIFQMKMLDAKPVGGGPEQKLLQQQQAEAKK